MGVPRQGQHLFDSLAIGASFLCLVHCLVLPILIVLLPALAAFLTVPAGFHLAAFAFAVPASAVALWVGFRRHRRSAPAVFILPGLLLLALALVAAPTALVETILTVAGALLLSVGHALNWRLEQRSAAMARTGTDRAVRTAGPVSARAAPRLF
ncbi:hypothetical protein GGR88_002193 [Sphingomonas jejuensis]|uniref:MerC mercury resistance protein n=1 Tax=Sphingomonas jejuensis TaxID=904715 RepID=A0ABX0XMS1_9SPHN|nr:MerC domain-containing protein [Sphingomonas jejuensis]NJC34679.1 hypothetical protein [Sphingomonas jejuensis]